MPTELHAHGAGILSAFDLTERVCSAKSGAAAASSHNPSHPHRYTVFNLTERLRSANAGAVAVAAELGFFKFGYMDIWCNTTEEGASGCRALRLRLDVMFTDGTTPLTVESTVGGKEAWVGTDGPRTCVSIRSLDPSQLRTYAHCTKS